MQNIAQTTWYPFFENTPLEVRNDIKRSLGDEFHRYPHVEKTLQLCEMTKEELSLRRMTTLNPSAKVRTICASQEKEIIPTLKVLVLFCLFVCLFVLQSCEWLEGIVLESAKGL